MYRQDNLLELADLKLRLYVEYCRSLQYLYEEATGKSKVLDRFGLYSKSYVTIRNKRHQKRDVSNNLLDLLYQEERAWKNYNERCIFIRSINEVLKTLNDDELNLLYLRYERKWTLRKIGEHYAYSYMQISRNLDSILMKFEFTES